VVSTLYHANEVSTDQPQSLRSHSLSEGSHGKAMRAQSSRVLMAALVKCQYRHNGQSIDRNVHQYSSEATQRLRICESTLCVRKSRFSAADKRKLDYQMWLLAASAIRRKARSLVDGVSTMCLITDPHMSECRKEGSRFQHPHYRSNAKFRC
jgi:hypothetical protein